MRDEGNLEFNEAKRSKEDMGPRNVEENFNRFPNRKNFFRWRNQGRFKEETASGSEEFGRRNFHNQGRSEDRNSPNVETGQEGERNVGGEGRFKRNNSPYNWKNQGRSKEQDNSNRYNRSRNPHHWQNQHRNSPSMEVDTREKTPVDGEENWGLEEYDQYDQGMEVEAGGLNQEPSTHKSEENCNNEDKSYRYNKNNTSHPLKNVHNQDRSSSNIEVKPKKIKEERTTHKNMDNQEICNVENYFSNKYNRSNSAHHPEKNIHNADRNRPNVDIEAKKIREETSTQKNVENEEICNVEDYFSNKHNRSNSAHLSGRNIHNQDRNSPNIEIEARKIKQETSIHTNVRDERFKRNTTPDSSKHTQNYDSNVYRNRQQIEKERNRHQDDEQHRKDEEQKMEKRKIDERHRKEDSKQRHQQSESLRSSRDERQRKNDNTNEHRSRSKDKHDGKPRSKSKDRHRTQDCKRKLSVHDKTDLEDALHKEEKTVSTASRNDILEADHRKETLLEKMEKINKITSTLTTNQQYQTTQDDTNLNMDILRADLNISNDSTGLPANTSDMGTNSEVVNKSSDPNESVDKNLTTSFNSSNVSDDLTRKVTPTVRRRRCVMSFKN